MRKLVVAAICVLSLSLSVTTGRRCIKEARTRTGKKCCEQQLRRIDKALSRAGDILLTHKSEDAAVVNYQIERCDRNFWRMLRRLTAVFHAAEFPHSREAEEHWKQYIKKFVQSFQATSDFSSLLGIGKKAMLS